MMDALETATQIFDLPVLFGACFLAFYPTAGTGALLGAQLIDVRSNGEIIEVRQMPPPTATLDPPLGSLHKQRAHHRLQRLTIFR
jgi:hypothetical protein